MRTEENFPPRTGEAKRSAERFRWGGKTVAQIPVCWRENPRESHSAQTRRPEPPEIPTKRSVLCGKESEGRDFEWKSFEFVRSYSRDRSGMRGTGVVRRCDRVSRGSPPFNRVRNGIDSILQLYHEGRRLST